MKKAPAKRKTVSRRPHPRRKARKRSAAPPASTTALAVRTEQAIAPAALIQQSAIPSVQETVKNMEQVRRFITKCMNVDLGIALAKLRADDKMVPADKVKAETDIRSRLEIDWGTIPGVDKPFLKQPGAEKVLFWLNLKPEFVTQEITLGEGHLEIVCRVNVIHKKTKEHVFQGPDCSCTTMESNYRFRYVERTDGPPPRDDEKDRLVAAKLGYFRKKKEWKNGKYVGDKWVWYDRVENPNIYDERNKVRQIGQKRALVKCCRNMGALSEIFVADPGEWEIPDLDEGSPAMDMDYTEGGRKITVDGKAPSGRTDYEANWKRREADGESKLTDAQREIVDRKKKEAESKSAVTLSFFWKWDDARQEATITGPVELMKAHQGILEKYWNDARGEIVISGREDTRTGNVPWEEFKYAMMQRNVPLVRVQ